MWLVYMLFPEVNDSGAKKRGQELVAQGLVRIEMLHVGHAKTEQEARKMCLSLGIQTLKEHKLDTTVVGFGIRNYYAKKGAKLHWKFSVPQLVAALGRRKARMEKRRAVA